MRARGVVRITPDDVGARVSVRSRIHPPGTGASMTDTVGVLESWDGGSVKIRRRDGVLVELPEALLIAGRTIPPEMPPRRKERR